MTVQPSGILLEYSMAVVINNDLMSPALLNKGKKKKAGIYPVLEYNYSPFFKIIYPFANPILFPFQLLEKCKNWGGEVRTRQHHTK